MQDTMQAVLQSGYGNTDVLRLGRVERPAAGAGEVVVAVRAAGLDRGTWHLMTGRPYLMRVMGFGFSGPKNPVPGLDVAGMVVEVGAGVTRFRVGDEVFGIAAGSFAEYAAAREDKLAHKPANLTFEQAALLGVSALTALQALDAAGVVAGERVLVVGASGGVGTYAVQLARERGAVVTGVSSPGKVDLVRSLGAERVLDYTRDDLAAAGRHDVILDVGGNAPVASLRRALTPEGRLVFVGNEQGGDWTAGFGRTLGALLLGRFVRQRFVVLRNREHFADLERIAALAGDGKVAPSIDRVCPLSDVPAALRDMEAGKIRGKVAVAVA